MPVNTLLRNGLLLLLLALLVFLPAVGMTQESQSSQSPDKTKDEIRTPVTETGEEKVPEFNVSPNRCVTLRQGQPCFVRIRFEWQSSEVVKACVYGVEGEKLKCWQAAKEGVALIPQTLPNTTEFILVDDDGVELTRASVSVAWVYKKKRSKRRWRLF